VNDKVTVTEEIGVGIRPATARLTLTTFPPDVRIGGNQPASTGRLTSRRVQAGSALILVNADRRAEALESVELAIAILDGFEGNDSESLIANYAKTDLQRVGAILRLEREATREILSELESIRTRLEKVRGWFARAGGDLARSAVVTVILRVLETLVLR